MVTFPNAKINLGLNIIKKRSDGFHDIESIFYPITWSDILEIIPAEDFSFTSSGLPIPGSQNSNLVIKAFQMLKVNGLLAQQNAKIHLHKILPMGAGIGGGSADGAFALKMLNDIFNIKLSITDLQNLASQMGSDCPFFIENTPKFCFGKGTDFEEINFNLSGKYILLVNPQIHISTAEAYAGVCPQIPSTSVKQIIQEPMYKWKDLLVNDFEASIIANHPKIAEIKTQLYDIGAIYASMTGSGSTIYGIFDNQIDLPLGAFEGCINWQGKL